MECEGVKLKIMCAQPAIFFQKESWTKLNKTEQNWTKLEQNLSSVRASILPVKYIFTFTYCGTAIPLSIMR